MGAIVDQIERLGWIELLYFHFIGAVGVWTCLYGYPSCCCGKCSS